MGAGVGGDQVPAFLHLEFSLIFFGFGAPPNIAQGSRVNIDSVLKSNFWGFSWVLYMVPEFEPGLVACKANAVAPALIHPCKHCACVIL